MSLINTYIEHYDLEISCSETIFSESYNFNINPRYFCYDDLSYLNIKTMKIVYLNVNMNKLPVSLEGLYFYTNLQKKFKLSNLPSKLKVLILFNTCVMNLSNLPITLEKLYLINSDLSNLKLDNLPSTLKVLMLKHCLYKKLKRSHNFAGPF